MNEIELKIKVIEDFLKESMCADGIVKFDQFTNVERGEDTLKGMLFEINDSNRGKWFIAWVK